MENKQLFTKGEEIFNAVSHIVGAVFGVICLTIGVAFAAVHSDAFVIVSVAIYGVAMILLYTASAIYHFLRPNKAKRCFRVLDHCSIFLFIAATYTPFALGPLREAGAWGWSLFGVVWFLAIIGIVFNAINMHNKTIAIFSQVAYLAIGWVAVVAVYPIFQNVALPGIILLFIGGLAYTIGALFYAFGSRKKYIHSVWHLFVLAGSLVHFFAILFYVILV